MTHFKGFIVHAYVDLKRNRLFLPGRLEDGRSFAIVETRWRPCLHISEGDKERVIAVLRDTSYSIAPSSLQSFSGVETLFRLDFPGYAARSAAVRLLEDAGITGPDTDAKPADLFLIEKCIKGPVEILGEAKPGRRVDLVFTNPELRGYTGNKNLTTENTENTERRAGEWPLRIASIDIETDTHNGTILAVAIAVSSGSNLNNPPEGLVRVLSKNFTTEYTENTEKAEKIIKTPCSSVVEYSSVPIFHKMKHLYCKPLSTT